MPHMEKMLTKLAKRKRGELARIGSIIRDSAPRPREQAYIDARYKKDYKITKKQLEYLAKRVKLLQRLTKKICVAKIESFV